MTDREKQIKNAIRLNALAMASFAEQPRTFAADLRLLKQHLADLTKFAFDLDDELLEQKWALEDSTALLSPIKEGKAK